MDKNEEKLLKKLSGGLSHGNQKNCPSLEDISALIDGVLQNEVADDVRSHIASCDICYETYMTASELNNSSPHTSFRIFSTRAIAASVFIVLVSFVIFYKVNVSVKDEISHIVVADKNPLVSKEKLPEIKKDKNRVISPAPLKIAKTKLEKTRGLKRSESEKKKSSKSAYVEESRPDREEPAGRNIGRKAEPGNVQGVSLSWNEPLKDPSVVSDAVREVDLEDEDQNLKETTFSKYKSGKGLITKLSEDEETDGGKNGNINCFKKKGDKYKRYERFRSSLLFEKHPPSVLTKIQPEDIPGSNKNLSKERFTLEVTTDGEGNITKLCLLAGNERNIREIIAAFRSWKFVLHRSSPVRFRVVLGFTPEGCLEILNKK